MLSVQTSVQFPIVLNTTLASNYNYISEQLNYCTCNTLRKIIEMQCNRPDVQLSIISTDVSNNLFTVTSPLGEHVLEGEETVK